MNTERRMPESGGGRARGPGAGPPMAMPVQKAKDFKGTIKRLFAYLKPYKLELIAVLLAAVLSTAFGIVGPKIMGDAISKLYDDMVMKFIKDIPGTGVDFEYILRILLILGAIYIMSSLFHYIEQIIMVNVTQKTVYDMRQDIDNKLGRLPLQFFDSHSHGDILSRVTNDVDNISNTLQQSIIQLITAVVSVVGIFVMMMTMSPLLTLVTMVLLPAYILATRATALRSQKYFKEQQKTLGELNGHIEEMFTGHKIIKAFGQESKSIDTFNEINERLYSSGWKAQFMAGIIMPLIILISNIGFVIISVLGAIMVTQRMIRVGDILAFIQYSRQLQHPVIQTANIANIIQSTVASAERIFELLDETEEKSDQDNSSVMQFPRGEIEFKNVKFRYSPDKPLIENMNIYVKPGQRVAIVGPTGAGKTTLVNLLMRFYEINDGEIMIDGLKIRELNRGDLRSMFGMVLQDTWLFNGTIRDNIAYGSIGASDEEIIQAAKAAHADRFIRSLADGYKTIINEEASNLSQGQKQLLTIARVILADPAILILDEATSNVDSRTEVHIQQAMSHLMKGRTSFIIAHRLSTIRDADLILVMNEGNVIEKGTHKELLTQGGFYADLYNSQFTGESRINARITQY